MASWFDGSRFDELAISEVSPVPQGAATSGEWMCGRCGVTHAVSDGWVVVSRTLAGTERFMVCSSCARLARRRLDGDPARRVVLVDDDADFREVLRRWLERTGRVEVVAEAGDGQTAAWLVKRYRADALVLDLAMPRVDGLQVLEQLDRDDDLDVIVLTAFPDLADQCAQILDNVTVAPKEPRGFERLAAHLSH
jgi:CheY-like chemotaxis protein